MPTTKRIMIGFSTLAATVCVVAALQTASIGAESNISAAVLPHPSCTYNANDLECTAGNYTIYLDPKEQGSFNLTLIPDDVIFIRLGRRGASLVSSMQTQFPNLTNLRVLEMYNFMASPRVVFLLLDSLLHNVKATLRSLLMRDCRVAGLSRRDLEGLYELRTLDLAENDILSLDVFAFEPTFDGVTYGRPFNLETIDLSKNKINSLRWETFAPIAHSLRTLRLNDQKVKVLGDTVDEPHNITGMTSLTYTSRVYQFQVLETLDLSGNALDFPWPAIFTVTLNVSTLTSVKLDYNAFCPNDPGPMCGCCEAAAFMRWAHQVAGITEERKPVVSFTCGRFGYGELPAFWAVNYLSRPLPALESYSGCCANEGDLGCICTTTTRRSEWGMSGAITKYGDLFGCFVTMLITSAVILLNIPPP